MALRQIFSAFGVAAVACAFLFAPPSASAQLPSFGGGGGGPPRRADRGPAVPAHLRPLLRNNYRAI